jgi:hypothetical protein
VQRGAPLPRRAKFRVGPIARKKVPRQTHRLIVGAGGAFDGSQKRTRREISGEAVWISSWSRGWGAYL